MVQGDWAMVTTMEVLGGRYVLREVLGTGGMATVYRATDQVLHRDVAVKVLSPQYAADPGFLGRFRQEARHIATLSSRASLPYSMRASTAARRSSSWNSSLADPCGR